MPLSSPRPLVRREKLCFVSGCKSHLVTVVQTSSNSSRHEGNEVSEVWGGKDCISNSANQRAATRVNVEQAPKRVLREPTHWEGGEGFIGVVEERSSLRSLRGSDGGTLGRQNTEHEKSPGLTARDRQPDSREGQAGDRGDGGRVRSSEETA